MSESATATVAVGFVDDESSAQALLDEHGRALARSGVFVWLCYPKANRADINRGSLRPVVLGYGLWRQRRCGGRCHLTGFAFPYP